MASKNPCGRQVLPEMAYEVYQTLNHDFTIYVLKKYKLPEQEAKDPYATWYCATKSPSTFHSLDYGDTYATEVKRNTVLVDNPLCSYLCLVPVTAEQLFALGIPAYHQTSLVEKYSILTGYYRVAVPKTKVGKFKNRLREFVDIRIVCQDDPRYMFICEADAQKGKG